MHGVRKNTLEIEVHGVEELFLVHNEAKLLQLNPLGCGDIRVHDSVEGTSKVNMIWILNVSKDLSQLCDILNAGIDDVLITKDAKRKMWCIQILTIIVFLEVNDLVQIKWDDVVCKG